MESQSWWFVVSCIAALVSSVIIWSVSKDNEFDIFSSPTAPSFIVLTLCLWIIPSLFGYSNTNIESFYEKYSYTEFYCVEISDERDGVFHPAVAQIIREETKYYVKYLYYNDEQIPFTENDDNIKPGEISRFESDHWNNYYYIKLLKTKAEKNPKWKTYNFTEASEPGYLEITVTCLSGIAYLFFYIKSLLLIFKQIIKERSK